MSEIAKTNGLEIQIVTDPKTEQTKGEAWKGFGVELYRNELRLQAWAQQIIASIPAPKSTKELPEFEKKLAKAKANFGELKEQRLKTTNTLNAVISRLMKPEKYIEDYIDGLSPILISLKKELQTEGAANFAKQKEILTIKESVLKYVADMTALLQNANLKLIEDAYAFALNNVKPDRVHEIIVKVKNRVTEKSQTIARPTINGTNLSAEEVSKVIDETFKPKTPVEFITEFNQKIDLKFSDFSVAVRNKGDAIKLSEADSQSEKAKIDQENVQAKVAASFVASATTIQTSEPGVKELKKIYKLKMEETQANSVIIMAGFVANMNLCLPHIRISKWFNFSVKQMINALEKVKTDDNNFSFTGLIFEETDKL